MPLQQTLFVTGTDTGVGKTWICADLARVALEQGHSVAYYKPIQTGSPPGETAEDCAVVQQATQGRVTVLNRYCFEPPVTPSVADTEGVIDFEAIRQDLMQLEAAHDVVLVEGAGGLLVPTTPTACMIDLIQALACPVILVAHSRLGTINHTLLSLEALAHRQIPVHQIVVNFYPTCPDIAEPAVRALISTLRRHVSYDVPIITCERRSNDVTRQEELFGEAFKGSL